MKFLLSIAIYSQSDESIRKLKSVIQQFLSETKSMANMQCFKNLEDFIAVKNYDIYIVETLQNEDIVSIENKIQANNIINSHFIYIGNNLFDAIILAKSKYNYFLDYAINQERFFTILKEIKSTIRGNNIIIKTSNGEQRISINDLNYIDIEKRSLCYHLSDKTTICSQNIRASFEKSIYPLQNNKIFLFLAPSLLINISQIKILNKNNIIFDNDDVLFYPAKNYDKVRDTWINYNRIID